MSKERFENFLSNLDQSLNIEYLMKYKNVDIYLLREDKLNFAYGGNKLRLSIELFKDFYSKDCKSILSYGSLESNFNRIIAFLCNEFDIPCYILHSLNENEYLELNDINRKKSYNEKLIENIVNKRYYCKKDAVKSTLKNILLELKEEKPYYIYGDILGKENDKILEKAYYSVYKQIISQNYKFNNIVLAYGTGSTFRGLLNSKINEEIKIKLYGISIARDFKLKDDIENNYILTDYIKGGYAKFDNSFKDFLIKINNKYNIKLDPIYTGKAFYGMIKEIDKGNILGKTLFIHTGGYPIYKDFIEKYNK